MNDNTKKQIRIFRWFAINAVFVWVLYAGVFLEIDGWRNVLTAWIWSMFVTAALLTMISKADKAKCFKEDEAKGKVFAAFDWAYDILYFSALAYCGSFLLATLYILANILFKSAERLARKEAPEVSPTTN